MAYWPGEKIQTLSINGDQLSINPGNTVTLPGGSVSTFVTVDAEIASISTLTVSTINGVPPENLDVGAWSEFPMVSSINGGGYNINNVNIVSTNQVTTNNILNDNTIYTAVLTASGINTNNLTAYSTISGYTGNFTTLNTNVLNATSTIHAISSISSSVLSVPQIINLSSINGQSISTIGNPAEWSLTPALSTVNIAGNNIINVNLLSTAELITSSINGLEFTPNQIIVSSLNTDSINTNSMSSLVSYVGQQLVSTIQFNPSVNISPQFNIDLNMGGFLTTLGSAVMGVAVAVPVTAGTITYGLVKGLASLFEPRPINNINNNVFETFNYASQLQVSTLGEYVSTIYRLTSTIPSTIVINDQPTFSTVSQTNVEIFVSTLSLSSTPTCIRAVADPVQIVSTPWTVYQGFGEWVEIPGGGGGIASTINVSTLSLSTLELSPSTILKGDLPQTLQVLSQSNTYNQVAAFTYTCASAPGDPNQGSYAVNTSNIPMYINSNFSTSQFALQGKQVQFTEVDFPTFNGNNSTITNLFITPGEPTLTYTQYPPGFPSTTLGKIQFLSSFNGGYSAVRISNQFDSNVSLTVGGSAVYATPMVVTNSNGGQPLTVQTIDLDEWGLLMFSTISGGQVGRVEILNTTTTNSGQLTISAPNSSNGGSSRIMFLDSSNSAVGINNPNPLHALDVTGNINATNNIYTNTANFITANISSLNVSSNLRWDETSFAAPQVFLSGGLSNSPVINTNVIASPYVDTLTFYKGFTNQDFAGGYICLAADNGLMGVNKIPQANVDLDVNGIICASNISTAQISTVQSYATQSVVSSIVANNVSTNVLNTTFGLVTNATISSITQPIQLDNAPEPGTTLVAGYNFDPFVGSRFGVFNGKQMVQGGYFLTTDSSLGGGNGQATFVYPVALSSMMTFTGTYFTNSTSPGINTPIWVGNGVADAFGRASTIQIYGDANRDIFCYFIGFV